MKKYLSKILVLVFAMITVLAISVPTFASTSYESEIKTIFDAKYYAAMNEDVRDSVGVTNINEMTEAQEEALWKHFWYSGIYELRQPSAEFNVNAYSSAYGDLRAAFGTDIMAYYHHYVSAVVNGTEKRTMTTMESCLAGGFNVYKVTDVGNYAKAGWIKATYYNGKHYAGKCYATALNAWTYFMPTYKTDMAELKIGYDSVSRKFYSLDGSAGSAGTITVKGVTYKALNENDAVYRELLDRIIPLYDLWYSLAPNPKNYSDVSEGYLNFLNAKPDLDALGIKYSAYYNAYYLPDVTISYDAYKNYEASGKARYIYIGNNTFAAKLDSGYASEKSVKVTKWISLYVKPCKDYESDTMVPFK